MIWDTFMFRDELDMLQVRLEQFSGYDVTHVLTEAPWTHRGVPKPLHYAQADANHMLPIWMEERRVRHLVDGWEPDLADPWVNERHQRNRAWELIQSQAQDDDWVFICDVDEIPSPELLDWLSCHPSWSCGPVFSVPMRTYLFAVDWLAAARLPPTCVVASARFLRDQAADGSYLAEVRAQRDKWEPTILPGGWHFSWVGGPEAQAEKLATATCHTEILRTREAVLIRTGERWRTSADGGGLPVTGVDVDDTWPAPIYERRVPASWFRPREDT